MATISHDSPETPKLPQKPSPLPKIIADLDVRVAELQVALEHSNHALEVLHRFSLSVGSRVQVKHLMRQVMESGLQLLSASKTGAIYMFEQKNNRLVLVEQVGLGRKAIDRFLVPGQGLAGQVFQKNESLVIADYEKWEGRLKLTASHEAVSALAVPFERKRQVYGVLVLFTEPGGLPFSEDDLKIAEMFAAQAAMAYQSIRTLERLEQELSERKQVESRERELRALAQTMFDVTQVLNASLNVDDVLDNMLANIHRIAPGDAACICLITDSTARSVRSRAADPRLAAFLSRWSFQYLDHPLFAKLVLEQRPLVFTNEDDFVSQFQPQFKHLQSFLGTAIYARELLIGFIFLGAESPDLYGDEYVRRLGAFASQSSLAIHNARLHAEVQSLAITDPLTGVNNRRGFLRFGRQEINRAMRFGRPLSMLFLDIDLFKAFNDRYSYETGDKVLEMVARIAQGTVRNVDLLGRYGGEEFIVLVPEVKKEAAVLVAERLRTRVEGLRLRTTYGDLGVTISIGVASMDFPKFQTKPLDTSEEDLLEQLIQRAGHMLRQAKETGRNRVCVEPDQGKESTLKKTGRL